MKLIEAIRVARKLGYKWLAIDKDTEIFCFMSKPSLMITYGQWQQQIGGYEYLGDHEHKFDWIESLIKLSDVKVK